MAYVAYVCERLRDGMSEGDKIFDHKQEALDWLNNAANGYAACNCTFALYKLGKELPLTQDDIVTPRDPVIQRRFKA